jgi:4'-phosphopantetheinyl transferase
MRGVTEPAARRGSLQFINAGEVHLWTVCLAASDRRIRDFFDSLHDDERRRASAFRFEKHRKRFIIARGLLRALLSSYTGKPAGEIAFSYGANGKPALRRADAPSLYFNLAYCEDQIVYALHPDCELGVDLERVRELPGAESLARRFFADEEYDELLSLSGVQRNAAFFNCWTRKEACLKAAGDGLFAPLDRFQVSLKPGDAAAVLSLNGDRYAAAQWTLLHITPLEDFVGAVALPTLGVSLEQWKFQDGERCARFLESVG